MPRCLLFKQLPAHIFPNPPHAALPPCIHLPMVTEGPAAWPLRRACTPFPKPNSCPQPHCLRSNLPMVTEVARSLAFAPRLHAMADRVVAALTDGGRLPFNGVHLRVEKDARDWASIMGGTQVGGWL